MSMRVEVVYALPERQKLIALAVPEGTTMLEAVRLSGIEREFPELDAANASMGIFGKVVADPARRELKQGERVEIYRPLTIDPKAARRARAGRAQGRR